MGKFVTFFSDPGEIDAELTGNPPTPTEIPEGASWVEVDQEVSQVTHYVYQGAVALKREVSVVPSNELSVAADGASLVAFQISEYSDIRVTDPSGQTQELSDDEFVFSTLEPGRYVFRFEGVEVLTFKVVINAY